jgi:hypothetical protein
MMMMMIIIINYHSLINSDSYNHWIELISGLHAILHNIIKTSEIPQAQMYYSYQDTLQQNRKSLI